MTVFTMSINNKKHRQKQETTATKLGNRSDEALNASSLQFYASVKRFIASLL
jgi:hypothetical protein